MKTWPIPRLEKGQIETIKTVVDDPTLVTGKNYAIDTIPAATSSAVAPPTTPATQATPTTATPDEERLHANPEVLALRNVFREDEALKSEKRHFKKVNYLFISGGPL